jgi:hypothetical protein
MKQLRSWAIASVAIVLVVPATLAAGGTGVPSASSAASATERAEAASVKLQDLAIAKGALGVYKDEKGYVVVRPSSRGDLTAAELSVPDLSIRVEAVGTDVETVDRLIADLEALNPRLKESYGFGFDPESGKVLIQSEAPEAAFATVTRAYPGLVDFRPGKWDLTSWDNDGQPHWGGAWVQQTGGNACTSAFAIADNNGHRYMTTAGHCFPNGVTTNMGKAWRPGDGYPLYDFEFITGHTVSGYLYDSSTHGRKVKNAINPGIGSVYCTTGRNSGFQCDWTVRRLNQTMCYGTNGECYHSLAAFNRPSGAPVQLGDSGGPLWLKYSDGTAGVRGVISGRFWDVGTFQWLSYATQYQQAADFYVMHAILP